MLKTIFSNGEIIIRVDSWLKHCVTCGRLCPYKIYYPIRHYGWRICFEHLSPELRELIKSYYV